MRIEQTFQVAAAPDAVFDCVTDPSRLTSWQTTKTSVEQLTDGPPGLGTRVRERTKPPGAKEFEQVVEFTEFERPRRLHVHVVEGPYPIDATYSFRPDGAGTSVTFVAEGPLGGLMRLAEPVLRRAMARQFAGYHEKLRRQVEAG
ncbi:MAG TPA: SRPBCC family protein [Thermoleophilaceae bacterium]